MKKELCKRSHINIPTISIDDSMNVILYNPTSMSVPLTFFHSVTILAPLKFYDENAKNSFLAQCYGRISRT